MGESVPAADVTEIRTILGDYLVFKDAKVAVATQVDPDATIFELKVDGISMFLLEEDYVSDVEGVLARFTDYGLRKPQLLERMSSPEAFDYEPYLKAQPEYFTKEGDDFNRLRLYETDFQPQKLKYAVRYFLARNDAS